MGHRAASGGAVQGNWSPLYLVIVFHMYLLFLATPLKPEPFSYASWCRRGHWKVALCEKRGKEWCVQLARLGSDFHFFLVWGPRWVPKSQKTINSEYDSPWCPLKVVPLCTVRSKSVKIPAKHQTPCISLESMSLSSFYMGLKAMNVSYNSI